MERKLNQELQADGLSFPGWFLLEVCKPHNLTLSTCNYCFVLFLTWASHPRGQPVPRASLNLELQETAPM